MPTRTNLTGPSAVTTTPSAPTNRPLGCKAFSSEPTLAKIAAGAAPALARGAPRSEAVKTAQLALFSLGVLKDRVGIDGAFGPKTEAAVKAFQKNAGVVQSGKIDAATLRALDDASSRQIATLKGQTLPNGSKKGTYRIVADISDPTKTRLYVLGKNDQVAARYLTSPGTAEFPTRGDSFKLQEPMVRRPWNPPSSSWARNAKTVPPGLDNPMGIAKLPLGEYAEYIHGIPAYEEADLGHAASHGCLRVSGSNILELKEKYAEAGTSVTINRDRTKSASLEAAYNAARATDRPTDAGREYLFGYVSGELG